MTESSMHYFKTCLLASLIFTLCACQDKPKADLEADSASASDPKLQALLNTPVSDIDENTVNDFLAEEDASEPTPEQWDESEEQQPQEEFEIKAYREITESTMTGYIDKIDILSLNDHPTTIKAVVVNRGNCRVISLYDHQNMRYGSVALAYPRCNAAHIREVSVNTNSGTYTYKLH